MPAHIAILLRVLYPCNVVQVKEGTWSISRLSDSDPDRLAPRASASLAVKLAQHDRIALLINDVPTAAY